MEKLFILGNGFDLAHDLKTEYKNFRNWIIKTYELKVSHSYDNEDDFSQLGIIKEFIDGKTEFQEDNLAELFLASIDYANEGNIKWKEFEESLSKLPYEFFDKICVFYTDKYVQPYKEANNAEIFGENLSRAFVYGIEKFFSDWIKSITVENKKRKKLICNNLDCTFLSFNYTSTLEDLYEVPDEQICHIHGYIKKMMIKN